MVAAVVTASVVATSVAGVAATEDGGIGAEYIEPTAVVPKKFGIDGARERGGRSSRVASDAGIEPQLAAPDAEAGMVAGAIATTALGATAGAGS